MNLKDKIQMLGICISKHGNLPSNSRLLVADAPNTPKQTKQIGGGFLKKIKLTVRLEEKEYSHLKQESQKVNMKMEPYIRKLIMGAEVRPRPPDDFYKLLREINSIGVNINQIAHIANAEKKAPDDRIEYAVALVDEIMEKVRDFE